MLALSPRAVERLETYTPPWPMPKIFRLTKAGRLNQSIFEGSTINTPSMLCVEDAVDALRWAESIGGLPALIARSEANLATVSRWVETSAWAGFLARDPATRSCTSMCLRVVDAWATGRPPDEVAGAVQQVARQLESEQVAYDIGSYRDAPAGLRLWGGATVETADLEAVLPWLDWAWAEARGGA
jgi:phosphoserine aminotransferase